MGSKCRSIRWTKELTPSHVFQLIRAEPDVRKALEIFDSATAHYPSGFRHDLPTFALLLRRLAAAGLLRPAEAILARLPAELHSPPPETTAVLPILRACRRLRRPLDALRLFRLATANADHPLTPTARSYTALLAALVAGGELALARKVFEEMRCAGVQPSVATCNVLIRALCNASSVDAAFRVFRGMPGRNCPPDACTYSTLIDGLCKNDRLDDARKLFVEMGMQNCMPTVVTYTSLIHGLCCSRKLDEALELFDEMGRRGVEPNVVTFCSLVDGLCKGGRALKAMQLLDRMVTERCPPNAITYSALIDGLCKEGRLREAVEVLDRMRLQGRKPDAGLYGKLITGLCDTGRYQEAANYLDEMVLSGISPNRVTWSLHVRIHNIVIRGLCSISGGSSRAFQVYQCTQTRGISVEPETFHCLVDCFCKKGDVHKAARIISEMLLEGCAPEKDTWYTIMGGYWDRRKVREAAELVWDQLAAG